MVDLNKIKTEGRNVNTIDIDVVSTIDILKKINNEDKLVAFAVEEAIYSISLLVDKVYEAFLNDGRLIYMGAGTSGRVGILDAVECPPTYGVSFDMVQCLMAGGEKAFIKAVEGAEDSTTLSIEDLKRINLSNKDVVVGIAASGRTPYVVSGIKYAKEVGCVTSCIVTSPSSVLASLVDIKIEAITGEEAITGSTRMKSGTAQKMICNMISTASMIKIGKVYQNLMIDVMATNDKLVSRSYNIISQATSLSIEESKEYLEKYHTVKKAIFAYLTGICDNEKIDTIMMKHKGNIREALKEVNNG